jgi:hypothetical protein
MTISMKVPASSREQFLLIVQQEMERFEREERELRKEDRAERARLLKLPE